MITTKNNFIGDFEDFLTEIAFNKEYTFVFKQGITLKGTLKGKIVQAIQIPGSITTSPQEDFVFKPVFAAQESGKDWFLGIKPNDIDEIQYYRLSSIVEFYTNNQSF